MYLPLYKERENNVLSMLSQSLTINLKRDNSILPCSDFKASLNNILGFQYLDVEEDPLEF